MNSNNRATILTGYARFCLMLYRILFPKATAAEINAYMYNITPGHQEPRFFSGSQIMRAEDDMGISRKCGAATARQANLPENVDKRHQFWTMPFPYGILGVHPHEIIDFDEAVIFVETTNRGYNVLLVRILTKKVSTTIARSIL